MISQMLDLFPEDPAPMAPPARKARIGASAGRRVADAQPATGATVPLGVDSAGVPQSDPELLARQLEAHPDYRVLRRLQARLRWPAQAPGAVTRVVILDTETTGLDAGRESIIELALLCVDIDQQTGLPVGAVEVYDGLEDPGKSIPPEIVALTGIRDADVKGQVLDESRIADLLAGADLVIAHNAGFDRPFVERRIARFAQLPWACSYADIDWKEQGRASSKLEGLAQALGLFYDAHRAEMDCHALLAVLAAPLPKGPGTGLSQLLASASAVSYCLQANHAPFEEKDQLKARGYRWNGEQRVWQLQLRDKVLLEQECEWLKAHVYVGRHAVVHIEQMDALVKYSRRPGVLRQQPL